jgi:acetyltransferase-like isoleucine patch superfamily enzyme
MYSDIITASHLADSDNFQYVTGAVTIEDNAWIGAHAIILNDSVIRARSVIGAGCVFKGTSEPSGIYIGNPAKLIRYRKMENDYEFNYAPFFK